MPQGNQGTPNRQFSSAVWESTKWCFCHLCARGNLHFQRPAFAPMMQFKDGPGIQHNQKPNTRQQIRLESETGAKRGSRSNPPRSFECVRRELAARFGPGQSHSRPSLKPHSQSPMICLVVGSTTSLILLNFGQRAWFLAETSGNKATRFVAEGLLDGKQRLLSGKSMRLVQRLSQSNLVRRALLQGSLSNCRVRTRAGVSSLARCCFCGGSKGNSEGKRTFGESPDFESRNWRPNPP